MQSFIVEKMPKKKKNLKEKILENINRPPKQPNAQEKPSNCKLHKKCNNENLILNVQVFQTYHPNDLEILLLGLAFRNSEKSTKSIIHTKTVFLTIYVRENTLKPNNSFN